MHRILSIVLLIICIPILAFSQKVEKKSYERLLKNLLKHSVPEITVSEVKKKENVIFLDARESQEYLVSHIPGSIWIGYDSLRTSTIEQLDKNKSYIIYCSVGYRSEKISEKLISKGFKNTYNLYGGIFEWVNQGNPVQSMDGKITNKVHPYNAIWGIWLDKGEKAYR